MPCLLRRTVPAVQLLHRVSLRAASRSPRKNHSRQPGQPMPRPSFHIYRLPSQPVPSQQVQPAAAARRLQVHGSQNLRHLHSHQPHFLSNLRPG